MWWRQLGEVENKCTSHNFSQQKGWSWTGVFKPAEPRSSWNACIDQQVHVCMWRYGADGMIAYRRNIEQLFQTFRRVLQPETLFIWTTALPVSQTVRGGVILDTIRFLSDVLRYDILIANDFCSRVAVDCGFDVLDLHFELRRHIDLREADGIHWNAQAHRKITSLLFQHICKAWHVVLPLRLSVGFRSLHANMMKHSAEPRGQMDRSVGTEARRDESKLTTSSLQKQ